jgi:hypothetical protein
MEMGQYEQAYPILKRLAEGAAKHGMPVRAATLYLRAARARLQVGSAKDAVALAHRAIQLLASAGQEERVRALLARMIQELETRGHHDQAVTLRAQVATLLGDSKPAIPSSRRGALPTKCPACNGPVRADEVTWIDDRSAQCIYCGSSIQSE